MMDQNTITAFLISFVAGISTLLGATLIFFTRSKSEKIVSCSLGFAAGVMISVSFSDLLPEAQQAIAAHSGERGAIVFSVIFMVIGLCLAMAIDYFVPHEEFDPVKNDKPHQNLYRVGFVSMLAMMLHNFPEGIATFMAGYNDPSLGISIGIAIAFHNIPEGISVAMPIYFATQSKMTALKYTFLSGIAEPVGAILAFLVLRPFINEFFLGAIFAVVAGIMIYISFEELIPTSRQYGYSRLALLSAFAGICIMPLSGAIFI
ncbi:MAG: zinc transporter ZupT [Thermoanaerobacteraceae bacterium]|nr:zinc transporter ZupT [Thermoanaerobacteraceae bacterium]